MTVTEALGKALEALNGVTVRGKDDMGRMLGAIDLIEETIRAIRAEAAKEADGHGNNPDPE